MNTFYFAIFQCTLSLKTEKRIFSARKQKNLEHNSINHNSDKSDFVKFLSCKKVIFDVSLAR